MKNTSQSLREMVIESINTGLTTVAQMNEYLNRNRRANRSAIRQAAQKMVVDGELNRKVDEKGIVHYSISPVKNGQSWIRMADMLLAPVRGRDM